jgi:hypothetical protein
LGRCPGERRAGNRTCCPAYPRTPFQREQLLKRKAEVEKVYRARAKVVPIPTGLMKTYIKEMQARLAARQIGSKKEFQREIVKEVRIRGSEIVYLQATQIKTVPKGANSSLQR